MRRLPVDISTFSELRLSDYVYVDKTKYLYDMITGGRRYFLSRPRRFGKSLLVSTLKEILTANKKLFDGLWIAHSDYAWQEHGVIQLDFSSLNSETTDAFKKNLCEELYRIAQDYNIIAEDKISDPHSLLKIIVHALFKQYGQVAILVDEYDSPILKNLNKEAAKQIRDMLQQFFSTVKSLDAQIQFVFITGVSSFAKAGLFSGINNLQILTLRDHYAAICGYTDEEIDHYFSEHINTWATKESIPYDNLRQEIKSWYNGYSFGHNVPKVYNPFSVMNALHIQKFENFWFQSGAPTFLVEILKKEYLSFDPDKLEASKEFLGIFDVDATPLLSLMFQAGYLTITGYDQESNLYSLYYPNKEVRVALQEYLLGIFAHIDAHIAGQLLLKLRRAFINENIEEIITLLNQLFAHVPYQLHNEQEKYYHGLLIMICIGAGLKAHAEYSTQLGRIDLIIELPQKIYVIEIKFNTSAQKALDQIKKRKYYERFMAENKIIILFGLAFKRKPQIFTITYAVERL